MFCYISKLKKKSYTFHMHTFAWHKGNYLSILRKYLSVLLKYLSILFNNILYSWTGRALVLITYKSQFQRIHDSSTMRIVDFLFGILTPLRRNKILVDQQNLASYTHGDQIGLQDTYRHYLSNFIFAWVLAEILVPKGLKTI